nr:MAG TPA: hypothetical protein [Caudoviricetes sp.]
MLSKKQTSLKKPRLINKFATSRVDQLVYF